MIMVDRRIGSGDLVNYLPKSSAALDTLKFGDAAFIGYGPKHTPVRVGIEIKALGDACSSIRSGRFAGHQLPGLLTDYDKIYVIVEGQFRIGPEGQLQTPRHGSWRTAQFGYDAWMYNELDNWMNTISAVSGIMIKRTMNRKESAAVILNLYKWWTVKGFEKHRSHVGFDTSGRPTLCKPGLVRRVAAQFPGIGWEKSAAVAKHFKTVHDMVHSKPEDWQQIKGIGKVIATRTVASLRGENCDE